MIEELMILATISFLTFCAGLRAGRVAVKAPTPPPNWKNNPDVDIPPEENWALFLEQWNMTESDDERLDVIQFWADEDGGGFTTWEETEILGMAETAEMRGKIRIAFEKRASVANDEPESEEKTDA